MGVAFDRDGDDAAAAGGDFLDVGESLFVLEDGAGVVGVLRGDADDGEGFVDEGVGAVLHLACRVPAALPAPLPMSPAPLPMSPSGQHDWKE